MDSGQAGFSPGGGTPLDPPRRIQLEVSGLLGAGAELESQGGVLRVHRTLQAVAELVPQEVVASGMDFEHVDIDDFAPRGIEALKASWERTCARCACCGKDDGDAGVL